MTRLDNLKRKLAARKGKSGYEDNVDALEAAIEREAHREDVREGE